ncbi:MAG: hypothetical protein A2513_07905 [Sulfurimonas sp. RIFOXYD12_FULL_33_39]|uniref:DUF4149 domain-containing protein n=1 Tax=unclassified Sulfurimonas TaxID=2623549 RepID=UPI0008C9286C|nr:MULTISPECIES: DUF4149 domain-containing protein [unclassified Sulfurimonas]OHE01558.1 MAG: hypothetical protein A3G74_05945 [Sulfurimonas sp. RIFCSPLOWO2_12_FULL_34_6]OHE10015.1 MAG: hypothetical protein A2513_07905 [Sulfurimonas sp. RIFOXYD12_FULL_33_39]OHE14765.1 MAG: hypothetical protein A2530_02575 [Sulfurimonas sp. RIFOXYD2_FULL_34_21]
MKKNIYVDFSYLLMLAATFGATIVLGAFVAPLIFHTDKILHSAILDNYNAGVIMAEIFRRFSYWVYFSAFFVLFYELMMYKKGQRDAILFGSSVTFIFSAFMFSAVYVPKIISMHILGSEAVLSDTFKNIHVASELDFKIMALALLVLFIRRLMLLRVS